MQNDFLQFLYFLQNAEISFACCAQMYPHISVYTCVDEIISLKTPHKIL